MPDRLPPYGLRRHALPWLLLDAALPTLCFGCGDRLGSTQAHGACQRCWLGLEPATALGPRLPDGTGVRSAVVYTDLARRFLLRAKFGRRTELFGPLGRMMAAVYRKAAVRPESIVPVPSHPWDTWRRGFAPAVELSRVLSEETGVPTRLLLRRGWRPWTRFKRLDRSGRKALAMRAFRLPDDVRGERLLLVDDLATTGSTLRACIRCCRQAGAVEIQALVWAKAAPS